MSRNIDIVGKLLPNKADKDLFDTLFYSDDGLPLLKIIRKKDSEDHVYFEFQVDGAENPYATEEVVDEKIAALGRVLTYKGKVATIADLPASGNNPGDVWYVEEASAEYVWIVDDNVGSWEELGPVISDVPHAKKADLADYADNLTPYSEDSGTTQTAPFINQGTGCANGTAQADTGSFMQLKEKRGNAVVVNQLLQNGNFATTDNWIAHNCTFSVSDNIGSLTATAQNGEIYQSNISRIKDHKYLVNVDIKLTTGGDYLKVFAGGQIGSSTSTTNWQSITNIFTSISNANGTFEIQDQRVSEWDAVQIKNVYLVDLTQWFGSNDNIPADLLSHPENFFRYYQGGLSSNAGTPVNSNARYLTNIGRNLWDEEWEVGSIGTDGKDNNYDTDDIRSKNYIDVSASTSYYFNAPGLLIVCFYDENKNFISIRYPSDSNGRIFTTPANCRFVRIATYSYGATYNHDITISRYYPGESGYDQYYPHKVLVVVDTGSEDLGAFDVKLPSGVITRDSISRNLKDLNWGTNVYDGVRYFYAKANNDFTKTSDLRNLIATCSPYPIVYNTTTRKNLPDNGNITFWCTYFGSGITVAVRDDSISTVEDLIAKISGTLEVNKVTPTTEQGTPFVDQDGNTIGEFIPCDDFGSMFVSAENFNGIPMGNEIFYPVNYKAYLDSLVNHTDGDPTSLVRKSDMSSNKMYMYSLYFDTLSTDENEEISVYFNVISKDPNLFVSDSSTIVQENNFKTLCENYSGVYFTASGHVAFDDTGENKTVSYVKVNKYPNTYSLSIKFNEGGYYNKTIINNQGAFVEYAGLLSCGVKVEI